jgi:hypothetical protein
VRRDAHQTCHRRKGHLLGQQQQRLEQQREARQLAFKARRHLAHRAVRQLHPRHAHFQAAFVPEEVQVAVLLDHRVMHRMLAGLIRH